MTRPRRELISPSDTPYYHCISRCVRRAYLCGRDAQSGRDFSHRRSWVLKRMRLLAKVFLVDVCAYAIMSNHYHLVLRINVAQAARLTEKDVVLRWRRLYKIPPAIQAYLDGRYVDTSENEWSIAQIALWRERLSDLSWYMRALNEYIARRANAEDECTGRFWEGRFKSQALLDEQALLTCMVYVDLNPIRAGRAVTPETSEFTSIRQRIRVLGVGSETVEQGAAGREWCPVAAFQDAGGNGGCIPFAFKDYLQLVDWSGRAVQIATKGAIPGSLPPILQRLGVDAGGFTSHLCRTGPQFSRVIGSAGRIRILAQQWRQRYFKGMNAARALFGETGLSSTFSSV